MRFWDFLSALTAAAMQMEFLTKLLFFVFSAAFAFIAVSAYLKKKTQRLLFVASAFMLFALLAFVQVLDLFYSPGYFFNYAAQAFVQLLAMALLFFAIFRKE